MERCVVTGAGGFLGSQMVSFLKQKGHWVRAVDIQWPEFRKELWSQADERMVVPGSAAYTAGPVHKFEVDIQGDSHAKAALEGVDQIYHFAAKTGGVGYQEKHGVDSALTTARIDLNVLGAAKDTPIFFPVSASVYPEGKGKEEELGQGDPQGEYGQVKLMMTKLSHSIPSMRVGILGTIYGGLHAPEKEKFPQALCRKVSEAERIHWESFDWPEEDLSEWNGPEVEIWGDGTQTRTFLWMDDALEMIYEVMHSPYHGPVNIASDTPITVQEAADLVCEHAGIVPHYLYDTSAPTGHAVRIESTAKWNKHYKYRPQTTPHEGLKKLYAKMHQTSL